MEFQLYTQEDRTNFLQVFEGLKNPLKIKVDNIYRDRSMPQNRYYHYIKKLLADHLGLTPSEMHKLLLKEFALIGEVEVDGDIKCEVESTAGMNTLRMEKFLEDIRRWALTIHGLYLPMPNEWINDTDELKLKIID